MKAEIDYSKDPGAVTWVGERLLHQYWPLLAPYFRDILLPPHRHPEGDVISWSWESGGERAISGAELNTVRKKLGRELEMFADNLAREASAAHGEMRNQAALQELAAAMRQCVTELAGRRDAELARYACRTAVGVRLHSWGARMAAQPFDPERRPSPDAPQSPATVQSKRRRLGLVWAFGLTVAGLIGVGIWRYAQRSDTPLAAQAILDHGRETETRVNVARGKVVGAGEPQSRGQAQAPATSANSGVVGSNPKPAGALEVAGATASKLGEEERRGEPPQTGAMLTTIPSTAAGPAKPSSDEVVVGTDPSLPANLVGLPPGRAGLPCAPATALDDAESERRRAPGSVSAGEAGSKGVGERATTPTAESPNWDEATTRPNVTVTALPARVEKEWMTDVTTTRADTANGDDLKKRLVTRAEEKQQKEGGADRERQESPARDLPIFSVEGRSTQTDDAASRPVAALLPQRWQVRAGDWRVKMVADVILPTQPIPAGGALDVESLRVAIQCQQESAKPALLRSPLVTFGCAFAPVNAAEEAKWAWNFAPDDGVETTVIAGRAELRWRGAKSAGKSVRFLRARGGDVVSRVSFDAEGGVSVESAEGIWASWFVVVSPAHEDETAARDAALRWQTNSGLPLSPIYLASSAHHSARIEARFATRMGVERLVLFDPESGWGITGAVDVVPLPSGDALLLLK